MILQSLLTPLERGESLPARWYTDPAITEREIHQIFRKTWSYVGPANELTNVGDYITGYVGEIPVVVVRNETGLAALVNVCRHRRHEVMKGRGNAKVMQCGYHAWTYDLTGCLKGAPRTADRTGFPAGGLSAAAAARRDAGPWVFVNADRDADPLQAHYGNVWTSSPAAASTWTRLSSIRREEWEVLLQLEDDAGELPGVLPLRGGASRLQRRDRRACRRITTWPRMAGSAVRSAMSGNRRWRAGARSRSTTRAARSTQAQYHLLLPNMTININPGFPNLSIDVWMAERAERDERILGAVFRARRDGGRSPRS